MYRHGLLQALARFAALIFTLLVAGATGAQPAVSQGHLDLRQWDPAQHPTLSLAGDWHFAANQLLSPQGLQTALPEAATTLAVPQSWNKEISSRNWLGAGKGVGSYWLTITPPTQNTAVTLHLDFVCTAAQLFLVPPGGTAIELLQLGKVGKTAASTTPYAGGHTLALPFQGREPHQLLIQVANFDYRAGGLCGHMRIGSDTGIRRSDTLKTAEISLMIAMLFVAGMYSSAVYLQHRADSAPLWFTISCIAAGGFIAIRSGLLEVMITSQESWLYTLNQSLAFSLIGISTTAMLMFYCRHFAGIAPQRWLSANLAMTAVTTAFYWLAPVTASSDLLYAFMIYWLLQFGAGLAVLLQALRERRAYSLPMVAAVMPIALTACADVYLRVVGGQFHTASFAYALVFFVLVETQIIGRKFAHAFALADRLSRHLQDEVSAQTAELQAKNRKLELTQDALQTANQALKQLSITDGLTNVHNRMYFEQEYRKEWRRSSRARAQLSILMVDVDHFKQLNDSAGHLAGDRCLQAIAGELKAQFKRAGELVARYGGEEFVIMLPETDQRQAQAAAEAAREAVASLAPVYNGREHRITVSIGISSTVPALLLNPDHLLEAADAALYKAKADGRNRTANIPLLPSSSERAQQQ